MIECIFSIDYEVYGSGRGSLRDLVYEPARQLVALFNQFGAKFVNFVEVSELDKVSSARSDTAIGDVEQQLREMKAQGFELALHLHPQWTNARYADGAWVLDQSEYNLCRLSRRRIEEIVDAGIDYLRRVLRDPLFHPISFRAGNWLFQPCQEVASVLAQRGIRVDSSVFAGGVQHQHQLDYRPARRNGFAWRFRDNVNEVDSMGPLLELPIHTEMVPPWRMITRKRVGLQQKTASAVRTDRWNRMRDLLRWRQPLKFDFCRMTLEELTRMVQAVKSRDADSPEKLKPLVAIGHTKDLIDFETVARFLEWLGNNRIPVVTLHSVLERAASLP